MKLSSIVFASIVALAAVAFVADGASTAVDYNTNKSNSGAKTTPSATTCPAGYVSDGNNCVAPPTCSPHSALNLQTNSCECDSGYVSQSGNCVTIPLCSPHSALSLQTNSCECNSGYVSRGNNCAPALK